MYFLKQQHTTRFVQEKEMKVPLKRKPILAVSESGGELSRRRVSSLGWESGVEVRTEEASKSLSPFTASALSTLEK